MRRRPNVALVLVPLAAAWSGAMVARAKESAAPGPSPRPLARGASGTASAKPDDLGAAEGRTSRARPGPGPRDPRSQSAPARLSDPTDGGAVPSPYGQWVRPGASGQSLPIAPGAGPPVGPAPPEPAQPGGMPGAEAGVAPTPGAEPGGLPGPPARPPTPSEATAPATAAPSAADLIDAVGPDVGAGFGGTLEAGPTPFVMIGDLSPVTLLAPVAPSATGGAGYLNAFHRQTASPVAAVVRGFKIADNQSPRPQDRIYFNFNYFNNMGDSINARLGSPVTQLKAYVYTFGAEKTFNQGMGSIGVRLPIDNLTGNSYNHLVNTPTSTALGNLTIYAKYLLAQNVRTGSLVSACWAITPQTATSRFAGAPYIYPFTNTYIQACVAFIYNYNRWYFQGFNGFNFAVNPEATTLYYADVGVGYYVYNNPDRRALVTAVAPTFEVHVDSPLNHRDWYRPSDRFGLPDNVDLTFGLNFRLRDSAILSAAFVAPVAAPKAFDSEAVLMLNILFGRSRRTLPVTPPPM